LYQHALEVSSFFFFSPPALSLALLLLLTLLSRFLLLCPPSSFSPFFLPTPFFLLTPPFQYGTRVEVLNGKLKSDNFKTLLAYIIDVANTLQSGNAVISGFQLSSLQKVLFFYIFQKYLFLAREHRNLIFQI
jgi:hypothetical protein